jgi:hypothetical protein
MFNKIKWSIYTMLGFMSAYLFYWIASLSEKYTLSLGTNCFLPVIIGVLTAIFGLVVVAIRKFR